jgi:hypothetical protein
MMQTRKANPRAEYRLRQSERIGRSASLAERFPRLKSLRVELEYYDASGQTRTGGLKYKPSLEHAKSLFCFNCVWGDCIGGDYDLSAELARAVLARRRQVAGELRCQGVRHNRERKTQLPCQSLLRYKLNLAY